MGIEICKVFALMCLPFQRDHQIICAQINQETKKRQIGLVTIRVARET